MRIKATKYRLHWKRSGKRVNIWTWAHTFEDQKGNVVQQCGSTWFRFIIKPWKKAIILNMGFRKTLRLCCATIFARKMKYFSAICQKSKIKSDLPLIKIRTKNFSREMFGFQSLGILLFYSFPFFNFFSDLPRLPSRRKAAEVLASRRFLLVTRHSLPQRQVQAANKHDVRPSDDEDGNQGCVRCKRSRVKAVRPREIDTSDQDGRQTDGTNWQANTEQEEETAPVQWRLAVHVGASGVFVRCRLLLGHVWDEEDGGLCHRSVKKGELHGTS